MNSDTLQVRPMGTVESRSTSADPTTAILAFGFGATQSDFVEVYKRSVRNMEMVLSKIPSQQTPSGLQALGFQSAKSRQWGSSFLGISAPPLQEEAHRLLLDLSVPHQTLQDLAMQHVATQPKIPQPPPKITQSFNTNTPVPDLPPKSQVQSPQASLDRQASRPLDTPTTAHLEEYRKRRVAQETAKARLGLSLFDESDKHDVTFAFADLELAGVRPARRELETASAAV